MMTRWYWVFGRYPQDESRLRADEAERAERNATAERDQIGRWYEEQAEEARRLRAEICAVEKQRAAVTLRFHSVLELADFDASLRRLRAQLEMAEYVGD